ncbi:MAG: hypothetical protein ACC658_12875 [Acidimicrobiia bacterium]
MAFRSHVVPGFDLSSLSNGLMSGLVAVTGAAGVAVWTNGAEIAVLWAPVHTFLVWALVRELDPDHNSTALVAGFVAGLWIVVGFDVEGILPAIGLLLAARVVVNTTGRRPLVWDLAALGVLAAAISFTAAGWVAGFGLALAIYIDDRMEQRHTTAGAVTAALAALGASLIATLSQVFPQQMPDIRQLLVVIIGVLALMAVVREPEPPTSLVDSRLKTPISQDRLHAGRGLIGVLVFGAAFLAGPEAAALGPTVIALTLVLISNEIERIRRRR